MASTEVLITELRADISQFRTEMQRAQAITRRTSQGMERELQGVNRGVAGISGAAASLGRQVLALGAAFVSVQAGARLLQSSVRVFSEFGSAISEVQAVTQASTQQINEMSRAARELGSVTAFSSTQAAQGMAFLGRAGFETSEIISAMPAVLDLAAAGMLDLSRAADIASNIMAGFNIPATEFTQVADILATVAANANTNIEQLGEAMKFVAPVAASVGREVGETAAVIGVLSNAGLQASVAGTGLRRVLSVLAAPTNEATEALAALGLELSDLDPTTNNFIDIFNRLAEANISAADAFEIFQDRGAVAVLSVANQIEGLEELTRKTQDADGASRRMATTMLDNLGGSLKLLKSAFDELIQSMGDAGLLGAIERVIELTTSAIRVVDNFFDAIARWRGGITVVDQAVSGALTLSMQELNQEMAVATETLQRQDEVFRRLSRELGVNVESITLASEAFEELRRTHPRQAAELENARQVMQSATTTISLLSELMAEATVNTEAHVEVQRRQTESQERLNKAVKDGNDANARANAELREMIEHARELAGIRSLQDIEKDIKALEAALKRAQLPGEIQAITQALGDLRQERAALTGEDLFRTVLPDPGFLDEVERALDQSTEAERRAQEARTEVFKESLRERQRAQQQADRERERALDEATRKEQQALQERERAWEQLGDRIQRTMEDTFRSILDGNFDMFDSIEDAFKNLLAQMAAAAARPILLNVATRVGGLFGFSPTGTGAPIGGGGLIVPPTGGIFGGATGPGTGILGGLLDTTIFNLPAQTPPGAPPVSGLEIVGPGQAITLGQLLGGAGLGISTGLFASNLLGQFGVGGVGNRIGAGTLGGAAAGTFVLPGIGTAIGAGLGALGGFISSLFGGGQRETRFDLTTVMAPIFEAVEGVGLRIAQGFEFTRTIQELDEDIASEISDTILQAFRQMEQTIVQAGQLLPAQAQDVLVEPLNALAEQFASALEGIDFDGKGFEDELDRFLNQTLPDRFNRTFGPILESIQRISPVATELGDAITVLEGVLETLDQQQAGLRQSLEAQLFQAETAFFTPAQLFVRFEQELAALQAQLFAAGPAGRIELIPQIQSVISELFRLAPMQEVLGQDPRALRLLREELTGVLAELINVSDDAFEDLTRETEIQINLAQAQLEALIDSVNHLERLDGRLADANNTLEQIALFLQNSFVGSFQQGGFVHRTGLAFVHGGEFVTPQAPVTVNVTVNGAALQPLDERRLSAMVSDAVVRETRLGRTGLARAG